MDLHLLAVFTLFYVVSGQSQCDKKLEDVQLVPKYADWGTPGNLKISYDDNSEAKCGNVLSTLSVLNSPNVTYNGKKNCKWMSIIMFDPDMPNPPHMFLHWFIVNIPWNAMQTGYKGQAGKELVSYFPPGDPTGIHRYTMCVYYQNKYIKTCKKYSLIDKFALGSSVDPRSLAKDFNLQKASACNFFYVTTAKVPILGDIPLVQDVDSLKKNAGNTDMIKLL